MPVCPSCGAENQAKDRFCLSCGKPLDGEQAPTGDFLEAGIVCPACDSYNEPSQKLCTRCGHSLSGLTSALKAIIDEPTKKEKQPSGQMASATPATKPEMPTPSFVPIVSSEKEPEAVPRRPTSKMPAAVAPEGSFGVCPFCRAKLMATSQLCLACGQRLVKPEPKKASTREISIRLRLVRGFGREDATYPIGSGGVTVGRRGSVINISEDPFLSPLHFLLRLDNNQLILEDRRSLNGTFLRIRGRTELHQGAEFIAGTQRFVLLGLGGPTLDARSSTSSETRAYGGPIPRQLFVAFRLLHAGLDKRALAGPVVLRTGPVISIGRYGCELNFSDDAKMAPNHLELHLLPSGLQIVETGATSGTYVRILDATALQNGDEIMAGEEFFRVEIG